MTQLTNLEMFRAAWIDYHRLADQLDQSWADTSDGKSAKPRAMQLADRIALGEMMLGDSDEPGYQRVVKRKLLVLQRELTAAQSDPADVARCYEFTQLEEQFSEALATVAGLYDQAKEVLGDDGIRALVATDRSDAGPARVAESQAQASLFFMG